MSLSKRYDPSTAEPALRDRWLHEGIYHFQREDQQPDKRPIYAIDTPPPTVSGNLHLGHTYSYSHTDFLARFWRMNGYNVFYPMGYDDNGLPTERLVEKRLGVTAPQVGRAAFIEKCLEVSEEAERDYQTLWQRLGLSIDWRYSYRTIDEQSRRISQWSFLDLYKKGLAYRREAPTIWCPECRTAIAQAELNDLERQSEFVTLAFALEGGATLPIATTRPELLPACVAVFVHPEDARYAGLIGSRVMVPLLGFDVPLLADPKADPAKGTGAVMCCTFGDVTDVEWWYTHTLPLEMIIGRDGHLTEAAGEFAGLSTAEARGQIVKALDDHGLVLKRESVAQSVRVHERCDTPVEYLVAWQWFIRVLDFKQQLLEAGEKIEWQPAHMQARYREWVENLGWDWCISRQRYFGVPFPLWYCRQCGEVLLASEEDLPIDPTAQSPGRACACGSTDFAPEEDVMDTWATSSMTPQIVGRWLSEPELYAQVSPFALRPQAHEIIRTWAFDTIVKSLHHFGTLPWKTVAISGWGLAAAGSAKISKSRGGGPMAPLAMIERNSADAVRYWAASTGFGKDAIISEERIKNGGKLITKLWNVARFSERFLEGYRPQEMELEASSKRDAKAHIEFTPADRWLLTRLASLIRRVTALFRAYEYAAAKSEIENFFWHDLADNYLEMCKERLYGEPGPLREGSRYALYYALLCTIKLFAPFLPYVTEEIYCGLFVENESSPSLHLTRWPEADPAWSDERAEDAGEILLEVATAVRRYKSEAGISLGAELSRLLLSTSDASLAELLSAARLDILSVTRAKELVIGEKLALNGASEIWRKEGVMRIGLER
ncbi:MAG TPA: valine--tRNA ligase [Ktedonobacteraceae bacterium]|nr:valine--tRNA ligase [Ktedonobacteraceae bacterium]